MTAPRSFAAAALLVLLAGAAGTARAQGPEPPLADVLRAAGAYVRDYEEQFSLLVAEELYVQEIRRPDNNPMAGNLSRANPGGGFASGGGVRKRLVLRSDYLLVRLGLGSGWMPFRDTFEVNGSKVADRDDRLTKLVLEPTASTLERASRIMADSTRNNLGSMTRTVNIPTLALMFLHPDIRERFVFTPDGAERLDGRWAARLAYSENQRPSLVKTTRGRDLPVFGKVWIESGTGVVLKTTMTAADPLVRAVITATYRKDEALAFWVPARMEEYYKSDSDVDEVTGLATYAKFRKFTVATDLALRRPQPE